MSALIAERIMHYWQSEAETHQVRDVRLGLGYSAVQLDDGSVGTAYTFRDDLEGGCSVFNGKRPLAGRPAGELLAYLNSRDSLESAVGLATANALANRHRPEFFSGDILEALTLRSSDRVGMVGYFAPVITRLEKMTAELLIFEQDHSRGENLYPPEDAARLLPDCQVALLTGAALINHTLGELLSAAQACREVVILGASTLLCPSVFASTSVTLLSGIVVDRPEAVLRVVSEGGGMRMFKGLVSKVNCRV